jgi:hypothetical protein
MTIAVDTIRIIQFITHFIGRLFICCEMGIMVRQNEAQVNLYCVNVEIDKYFIIEKIEDKERRHHDKRNRMEPREQLCQTA